MKKLIFIICFTFLLCGCSPVQLPDVNTYAITNIKPKNVARYSKTPKTILVSYPVASPGYASSAMVYMETPYELSSYARNRWVSPPAKMLMPVFVDALRHSKYFKAVVSPPFAGITDYRLDTQLLCLQQEFLLPVSQERLTVQATLVNNANSRVLATQQFNIVIKAPANDPYSGVLAANRAASLLSSQLVRFVLRNT